MSGTLGVRRKYRIRRFFGSTAVFIVVLALLVIFVQAGIGMMVKAREAREKRDLAITEFERLEARETALETEIARLSSDRGIEEELRDRFFVVKEGEKIAVVSGGEADEATMLKKEEKKGFWRKFLSAVGLSGE